LTDHDNLGDFQDGAVYDRQDPSDTGVGFYRRLAEETGGPVLEIGCGTGRVAIPIAQLGMDVTGLDIAPAMLLQAQGKSMGLHVRWIEADGRSFFLGERFRLIYLTGNTFQFFLTRRDQELLLERVRTHLADEGLLAFETRNPRWASQAIWQKAGASYSPLQAPGEGLFAYLEDSPDELEHRTYTDSAGHRIRESMSQRYDHARQILHWTVYRRWYEGLTEKLETTETAVRFTFPQELEAVLHYNGFEIGRQYGDWDLSPLNVESPSIIVVCRKQASVGQ